MKVLWKEDAAWLGTIPRYGMLPTPREIALAVAFYQHLWGQISTYGNQAVGTRAQTRRKARRAFARC
jgi:hypothetical protein